MPSAAKNGTLGSRGPGASRGSRGLPGVPRDVKCDRVWGPGRSHRASGSSLGLLRSPLVGSLRSPRDLGLRPRTCNFYCFRYAQGARRWGALYLCAGLSCEEGTVSADSIRILDTWGLKYTYPYTENVKYPKSIHVSMRLPGRCSLTLHSHRPADRAPTRPLADSLPTASAAAADAESTADVVATPDVATVRYFRSSRRA